MVIMSTVLLMEGIMVIERKNYPMLPQPVGAYVHAVSYQGLLYLSGLTAFGTAAQTGDLVEQAEAIFGQMRDILRAEGIGFERLLKVTLFVTDLADLGRLREVVFRYYQADLPASSLVQVKGLFLPDLKIEVEAIIALGDRAESG